MRSLKTITAPQRSINRSTSNRRQQLLKQSLASWQKLFATNADSATRSGLAINCIALARIDLLSGQYPKAELRIDKAKPPFDAMPTGNSIELAFRSIQAEFDTALARYDQATIALKAAIREAELGHFGVTPNHPYLAVLRIRLAETQLAVGDAAAAHSSVASAQKILDHAGLTDSRPMADALRIDGEAAVDEGKYVRAAAIFDQAMKLLRPDEGQPPDTISPSGSAFHPSSIELVKLLAAQGELANRLQNYTAAADDYHEALAQLDTLFESEAANHPLRARYLDALAMILLREDKFEQAKPLLEQALAIDRRALPPAHPATIVAMKDLADLLEKTGAKSQADELRRELKKLPGYGS